MPDTDITFHWAASRFSTPEESPGYLLWQVTMLWQRKMKRALDTLRITHTQFVLLAALAWLAKDQRTVTQADLAHHSNTDRMMVSKVLRTLQQKGLITRAEHHTDTRAKSVALTQAGKELLQQAIKVVEQVDQDFFAVLKTSSASFNTQMLTLLKKNV